MKIYDCFTFYNELDLLDLRLAELYNKVDYFVIVEATTTFQNKPKDLFYKENEYRYRKYSDKIIHVVVDDMPMSADPWQNERFQRDAIMRGLVNADSKDIAIIGDVDEFIRPDIIDDIRANPRPVYGFRMPYFNFKFNYMLVNDAETYCVWTTASQIGLLTSPEDLRSQRWILNRFPYGHDDNIVRILEHAGWHFTYVGDEEFIKTKIQSFAHSELNTPDILDKINVKDSIAKQQGFNPGVPRKFVMVNLDEYFPMELREHVDKYKDYIIFGSDDSARNFLPKDSTMLELANSLPTDKETAHKYISNFYQDAFKEYQTKEITLLEIGIWNGGSVKMWHEYFQRGTIIGTDITDSRILENMRGLPRAQFIIQDAYTQEFRDSLPDLDIVIDDGPHTEQSQIRCLELYLGKLKPGGMLVIEDILSDLSIDKFKSLVPSGYTYEVRDIRPKSALPESLMFIVKRQ